MEEKILTPKRVIGIIFLVVLYVFNYMYTDKKVNMNKYNTYPETDTYIDEDINKEKNAYVYDFFDNLANNKYEEAYAMLAEEAKIKDFDTVEKFSKYFKDHIIDNNKIQKEIDINLDRTEKVDNKINHYFNVVLSIDPKNMKKDLTFAEILNFYDGRNLTLTLVQLKPYEYEIFILKPNIPLTEEELEEYYIDNN